MTNEGQGHMAAADAATRLGVSRRTILRLVDSGQLVPVMKAPGLRGAYLFTEDEVARFEQQRAQQVPA